MNSLPDIELELVASYTRLGTKVVQGSERCWFDADPQEKRCSLLHKSKVKGQRAWSIRWNVDAWVGPILSLEHVHHRRVKGVVRTSYGPPRSSASGERKVS